MTAQYGCTRSLARGLQTAGVRKLFGVPGGGPNLDLIAASHELGLDFVLAHGETPACIMAAAYGQVTGTPGVAVVTRGPGFTSASNGLAQATLDRFPLLLISDVVDADSSERVAHQRLDQVSAARPLTKWSGTLGSLETERAAEAVAALTRTPPACTLPLTRACPETRCRQHATRSARTTNPGSVPGSCWSRHAGRSS